jgi:uncharacterized protein YyaL (SSP411 family)
MLPQLTRRTLATITAALMVATACRGDQPGVARPESGVRVETIDGKLRYTNRLIDEHSPYLQLHAHNPVDWYPWGAAAFDKARREGKPIFLSVGYSTCHWCHVMEAESFSDPGIADLMNRSFVSVKVDREERPDIDRIYMAYVQTMDSGGWPMSVFLTADLKPFLGASYLPPDDRGGVLGFRSLLQRVNELWTQDRPRALRAADTGARLMTDMHAGGARPTVPVGAGALDDAFTAIRTSFDPIDGGFGSAPKFPRPVVLTFLLRDYARTGRKPALDMTLRTLDAMARGGIHDQLGGGFHRYATDAAWRVPHFEKMLYDQAQLAVSYAEAYQVTKDAAYAEVARDILDYTLRDMRSPDGAFFSAEDADSALADGSGARAEGAFYVWSADELRRVLGREIGDLFAVHYGVPGSGALPPRPAAQRAPQDGGAAGSAASGSTALNGSNVLYGAHTVAETARQFHRPESDVAALLAGARRTLLEARAKRPRPMRDDKVLVAWNGLMLSALARAAQIFDDGRYLTAAREAAQFVRAHLYDEPDNRLIRRFRHGHAAIDGMLEDYAFLIQGLLDLYEASFDAEWLAWGIRLQGQQDTLFWDPAGGGYFSTSAGRPDVLVRVKDDYDGAEPAPNSIAAMNLLRLWQVTGRKEWRDKADAVFDALAVRLTRSGSALPQLASALDFGLSTPKQIVIAGDRDGADTRTLVNLVRSRFIPNKIVLLADGGPDQAVIAKWLPFVGTMQRLDGRATIYVCQNYACRLPTSDPMIAAGLLDAR